MTIVELYKWAKEHNAENLDLRVYYNDFDTVEELQNICVVINANALKLDENDSVCICLDEVV